VSTASTGRSGDGVLVVVGLCPMDRLVDAVQELTTKPNPANATRIDTRFAVTTSRSSSTAVSRILFT
jgi:hypothetical protein